MVWRRSILVPLENKSAAMTVASAYGIYKDSYPSQRVTINIELSSLVVVKMIIHWSYHLSFDTVISIIKSLVDLTFATGNKGSKNGANVC
jgi:hypothetical protein